MLRSILQVRRRTKLEREAKRMAWLEKWKPVILILLISFAFSTMNLLFKAVLNKGSNHLILITYRQFASTVFLTPLSCFEGRKAGAALTTRVLCYLFLSALLGGTLAQYFILLGLQHTSAAFCSAFVNMTPANTFVIALIFRVEKLNLRSKGGKAKVLGSAICIGGVLLLALYQGFPIIKQMHSHESISRARNSSSNASRKSTANYIFGAICMTLSSIVWSSWFVIQNGIGKLYPCKYSSTAFMSFFSTIQSAALSWAINSDLSLWLLRGKLQIVTVVFAGVVGSGLCYVGMSWCVEQRGPVFTAAFCPFQQIFLVILALIFLHEDVYLGSVLGSITVISGLYILLWGKSKDSEDESLKPSDVTKDTGRTSLGCTIDVHADSNCHLDAPRSEIVLENKDPPR